MASKDVAEFTDQNFQTEVLGSGEPVLVDFWAAWCGPCRAIAPVVEELAREYKGKVKFGKLDIDANQDVTTKYGVMSIPTFLIINKGEVVDSFVGSKPKEDVVTKLDSLLQK